MTKMHSTVMNTLLTALEQHAATLIAWQNTRPHLDVVLVRVDKSGEFPSNMDKSLHYSGCYANGTSAIEFVVWTFNRQSKGLGSGAYHCVRNYNGGEAEALADAVDTFQQRANR